jgi:hypothetical protein
MPTHIQIEDSILVEIGDANEAPETLSEILPFLAEGTVGVAKKNSHVPYAVDPRQIELAVSVEISGDDLKSRWILHAT